MLSQIIAEKFLSVAIEMEDATTNLQQKTRPRSHRTAETVPFPQTIKETQKPSTKGINDSNKKYKK